MSNSDQTNKTVIKMFYVVAFFILLFGGLAIYSASLTKNLKVELKETKAKLEQCESKNN